MYLVTEWMTMSAPRSSGFCTYGDKNVLSTTTLMPWRCAMLATARTSTSDSVGFDGLSIHTSLVWPGRIRLSTSSSMLGENVTVTPCAVATWVKYRCVPPYTSETDTTCDPAARLCRMVAVVALPDENANACRPCSNAAIAVSKFVLRAVSGRPEMHSCRLRTGSGSRYAYIRNRRSALRPPSARTSSTRRSDPRLSARCATSRLRQAHRLDHRPCRRV